MQHDTGHYNDFLVLFSITIALVFSFISLNILHLFIKRGKNKGLLLSASSLVMGKAIWFTHYTGMRALHIDFPVAYCVSSSILSFALSVFSSYWAMHILTKKEIRRRHLAIGGLQIGFNILVLHYISFSAMKMPKEIEYEPLSIAISALFAFGISYMAVRVLFRARYPGGIPIQSRILGAVLLGLAIIATHYVSMAGARFVPEDGSWPGPAVLHERQTAIGIGASVLFVVAAGWTSMFLDKRHALKKAAEHESRFVSLFENSPVMVVCYDPLVQRVVHVNSAVIERLGFSEEDFSGIDPVKLVNDAQERMELELRSSLALRLSEPQQVEFHLVNRFGNEMLVSGTFFPLIQENRLLLYAAGRDITEERATELELVRAKREAEVARAAKNRFLAAMSHEIRTPLTGIVGINELLQNSPINESQRELLRFQEKSSQALLRIMSDILDFSRIEAGGIGLQNSDFHLGACVEECLNLFAVNAMQKGIRLESAIDGTIPDRLYGDRVRLRQILVNLIGNAVKFTDHGFVRAEAVRVESLKSNSGMLTIVKFSIADTGIGIPPSKRELLFLPFSQVDSSMARNYDGAGLGLAICKNLVELMGGDIWMEEGRNGGSVFHIQIPFQSDIA
ncbi:MHYT domain-containing protein [Cohnella massiliensis]|uniref:sensor histidine kinase n=1 Tax=Cohnella massiliensis TaxID=1816691 RepID=UPI0009BC22F8|nr:ATP-binding protein [Cohnella massiliensis]